MGFFSGIRRRIKKLIPKEVRPAIPFILAATPLAAASGPLAGIQSAALRKAIVAGAAKGLSDDEAGVKDILRTSALAAAPDAISGGLSRAGDAAIKAGLPDTGSTMLLETGKMLKGGADAIEGLGALKTVGAQTATDFGIKQAELNQKAIEEYERDLLAKGIRDKAARRSAIFDIFVNAGYDDDEVNVMLDKYGYADGGKVKKMQKASMTGFGEGLSEHYKKLLEKRKRKAKAAGGRVGFEKGDRVMKKEFADVFAQLIKPVEFGGSGMSTEDAMEFINTKFPEEFKEGEFSESLMQGVQGLESAFGEPLGGRRPEPMRIIPGFAQGGDVDILETEEEEIITPEYLMKEEGVPIGEQVSAPDKMDSLNQLSLMLFNKPVFELTEEQFEMLKEFAAEKAAMQVGYEPGKYSDDEIEMYENYKYNMNEQMPGMPIIDIDEFLRMEYGAARMGVAKGGPIKTKKPDMEKDTKGKMAGPDYIVRRMEDLMDLGYDYDTAGRLAMDEDLYREAMDKGPIDDYKEGGSVIKKKKIISIGTGKLKDYPGIKKILEMNKKGKKRFSKAEGGLMNLGGKELDLRGGGFVPMGKKEKADDVPARLSKNEFVFTADAVRAAGGGSVQKGADLMYDTMKKLEAQS